MKTFLRNPVKAMKTITGAIALLLFLFAPGEDLSAQGPCAPGMNVCVTQGNNNPINAALGVGCLYLTPNVATGHAWQATASCMGFTRIGGATPIQIPPAGTPGLVPQSGTCPNGTSFNVSLVTTYFNFGTGALCFITNTDSYTVSDAVNPTLTIPATLILDIDSGCTVSLANLLSVVTGPRVADNCTSDPTLIANAFIVSGFPVPDLACSTSPNLGTTVQYRTADACGNLSNIASVTIRLRDQVAPILSTCPPDATDAFDANCEYTVADFRGLASATDACGSPFTYSQRVLGVTNPNVGPFINNTFPTITGGCAGPRVITIRICAQDCFGNGNLDPAPAGPLPSNCCTLTVTVSDVTPPVGALCPSQVVLPVDVACSANVPDIRDASIFSDNCSVIDPSQIGMYADLDGNGTYEFELFAPGTPVIPGGNIPVFAGNIICNPLFPNDEVDVQFSFIDCNGNPNGGPVLFNCDNLLRFQDVTAPDLLLDCPLPAPVFYLTIDPNTCIYSTVTIPQDWFNGIATVNDNCDGFPMERNDAASFGCGQLGLQDIPIWGEDCSGNVSGVLGNCQVLIQVNPLDAAWTNPGTVCMSDLPLNLCDYLDLATAQDCGYWSGDFVSPAPPDNRCNGGNPAIFEPTGPGVYTVTYTVGDANCHVELTRSIKVEQDYAPPFLVDNFGICLCPDAQIDLESYLLQNAPQGGEWTILSQVPNLGGPVTPGVNIIPPTGAGYSHIAKYDGGCLVLNLRYTITDCQGVVTSDDIAITINECPKGSFDLPDDMCQDATPFSINDTNRIFYGCFDYQVTFEVTSGPSGNTLIGGAPVTGTISTLPPVIVDPGNVVAGNYTIKMTINDPTGALFGCPDFVYNQVITIYKDGASPNGITPVSPLCEGSSTFPVTLSLLSGLDEAGNALVDADVRWTGSGVTDGPGINGTFQPADLDGDGWPGPGLFTVCASVGDPRCEENYCIDILINNDIPDNGNDLVQDFKICATPGTFIPYSTLLANGSVGGGTFSASLSAISIPAITGILLPNGFFYTGGCGDVNVTYTLPQDCNPDNINNDVIVTVCPRPDVEINAPSTVCTRDNKVIITTNMVGRLPQCDQTGVWSVTPATPGLIGMTDGTAMFSPALAGEGSFEVSYSLTTGANCTDVDRAFMVVSASSDPSFVAPQVTCVDVAALNLSLTTPDPSIQDGNPLNRDNTQEVIWTASCGSCLTVNSDSTTAIFNPSAAGAGTYLICATTGDPSCQQSYCTLIRVNAANDATLVNYLEKGCFDLHYSGVCGDYVTDINLSELYTPSTTRGGYWTIVTPYGCRILNETFEATPGCHELLYTVPAAFPGATDACAEVSDNVFLMITEEPQTDFDLAEEVCWDGIAGSVSLPTLYTGATFGTNASQITYAWTASTISGAGPAPTFSDATTTEPNVIINGAGTFNICLTETIEYELCADNAVNACVNQHCEILVVNQTNVEVIPTWTSAGPFCVDDICIDLDARITGNTGGVFTGNGVQLDPSHSNYRFCPSVAGPGTHTICYTVNNGAGCSAVECHSFVVYPAATVACADTRDTLQCATMPLGPNSNLYGPHGGVFLFSRYTIGTHPLNSMLCASATQGGNWTLVSAPAANTGAVAGNLLYFTNPGCYTVRYTVLSGPGLDGVCSATQDFTVHVGERPNPSFDLPDAICWDQVSLVQYTIPGNFITSPAYSGVVVRTYRSTNPAVATVTPVSGVITVVGNGTTSICMQESITTFACGVTLSVCLEEVCEVIRVVNNTTVANPDWSVLGPLCIDQACQDLDALVTGTAGGIFTGHGVRPVPGTGHPQYEFCPALAGVGTHVVTYTINSPDGCSASFSRNVVVYPAQNASLLTPFRSGCIVLNGFNMIEFDLTQTYLSGTTRGGTWTKISGPNSAGPFNETYYGEPGCHVLRYTVPASFPGATGDCGVMFMDLNLTLSEEPTPSFDVAEEICWNGVAGSVSLNPLYNGNTYGGGASSHTYNWIATLISGPGPVPTFNNNTIQNPTITVQGAGIFEICLTETLVSCNNPGFSVNSCSETYCERITIHQSNTEVIPTWTAIGPFCVDQGCQDLDVLVTGTSGGVFTGVGVRPVPGVGHPQYEFCPAIAGPGTHAVTYTVNNGAGCTAVQTHNITVFPAVTLACLDTRDTIQCATRATGPNNNNYGPFNGVTLSSRYTHDVHSLSNLLCATATKGGIWSYVSGPTGTAGTVANGILHYTDPGCYTVRYTVSSFPGGTGACTATQDFTIHVGEAPNPSFDLPDAVCWDQLAGSITYDITQFITSPAYTGSVVRNYRSTNTSVVTVSAGGLITVVGNGTAYICMEEVITTIACSGVSTTCTAEICEAIRVVNNTTVTNPNWSVLGPLCIDQACQDLDALVTGTPGGIFTGHGVRPVPGTGHPQYEFCPSLAGVGTHVLTYTVNSPDGCSASFSRLVTVFPANNASLVVDVAIGCINLDRFNPFFLDLSQYYTSATTRGGTWSYISGPGNNSGNPIIRNETARLADGCHQLRYTVGPAFPGGVNACGTMSDDIFILIGQEPQPDFDLAEEACWNGIDGSLSLPTLYNGTTFPPNNGTLTYNWTVSAISGGPVPTFSSTSAQQPNVIVHGAGTFRVCLTETTDYDNCGTLVGNFNCTETKCQILTIHQSNTEVLPTWTPIGPFCVDQPCQDLDALVTGTPNGVFTGVGVRPVPGVGHPQYEFCPGIAGPGTHSVTYTVQNGAGCTAVQTHNIVVYPAVMVNCTDTRDTLQCATQAKGPNTNTYGPFNGVTLASRYTLGSHNLTDLLCPTATRGGTWSFVSGPAASTGAVVENTLHFTNPGCYTVRYTVRSFPGATGACLATQDFTVHVGEMPNPSFDLPDAICWNQLAGSVTYDINNFITSPAYSGSVVRNYRSTNTSVVTINAAGIITVVGNGTASICMEEVITTTACGLSTTCRAEVCEVIRVVNSVTVNNPEWGPLGPLCIDMPCQDLDALVLGTTGGVFTGRGVRPVPGVGHPQYEFCPAIAGVGIHAVTYTVNSPDGCSATFTRNVEVKRGLIPNIGPDVVRGCYDFSAGSPNPFTDFDLSELYLDTTTRGGTWTHLSGPAFVIRNETMSAMPGCHQVVYTVPASYPGATGACGPKSDTAFVLLTEEPQPNFDAQDAVCWEPLATVTITPFLNSDTWGNNGTLTRTWSLVPPAPAGVTINASTGVVTIGPAPPVTPSTFSICLTERITYASCGTNPAGSFCEAVKCHQIKIESGTPLISCFTASADSVCVGTPITLTPLATPNDGIWTSADTVGGRATLVRNANGTAVFTPRVCGIFVVTYTRSTPNGCTNTCSRTIRTDLTPPVVITPGPLTVECDGTPQTARMTAWANTARFTDNCAGGSLSWLVFDRRSGCSQYTGKYIFEFTARDSCGNTATAYDTFTILDRIAPAITGGADLTINCGVPTTYGQLDGWLNTNAGASATDACSRVRWTNNFNRNSLRLECNNPTGTPVIFTATDECGNFSTVTFRVFLIDNNNPVWNVRPVNLTIECDGTNDPYAQISAWLLKNGDGVATDSCSTEIFYSNNYTGLSNGCTRTTGSATVTFTARDFCGNSVSAVATVTVVDRTPPEIASPAKDTVVECDGTGNVNDFASWIANHGGARAIDLCSGVSCGPLSGARAALVTDPSFPWGGGPSYNDYTTSMNQIFGAGNWDQLNFGTPASTIFSRNYRFIYIDGSDGSANAFNTFVNANRAAMEAWVACGGRLLLNSAPNQGGNIDLGFGGVQILYTPGSTYVGNVIASGPIVTGPYLPTGANYTGGLFGHSIVGPPSMSVMIRENGGANRPVLAQSLWGSGVVMFGGMTASGFHNPQPNARNLKWNILNHLNSLPLQTDINSLTDGIFAWDTTLMRTQVTCGQNRILTYMFNALDSCGNISLGTIARFIVRDTTPPVWLVNPANEVVDCDSRGNIAQLNAWLAANGRGVVLDDPCNGTVRYEHDLIREYDRCSNTDSVIYRFTATDCSGNTSFREATFHIRDVTPPVITGGYNKLTECDQSGAGNDDEITAWLDSLGGLSATDMCSDNITWRHNFSDNRWVRGCGDTRFQDVTFTATDDCGNFSTRTLRIGTTDTTKPVFFNCPRPPIVVAAETFHCDAYVNFSPMAAFDNCSTPTVRQIDKTGLKSGSRFPVGTTVLVFEAADPCGNKDTCTLKIVVNDFWDLPSITCPSAKTFDAALDSCGRTLTSADGIDPTGIKDNCPNTLVSYTITDSTGTVIKSGFNSAAGSFFPVGVDTITYCVTDQPLLKITEVTQQLGTPIAGGTITIGRTNPVPGFITTDLVDGDYLEIGNYGGGIIDLTCLSIEIVGPAGSICNYTLPPAFALMPMHFLAPGQVATFHIGSGVDVPASRFFHMNCTQAGINDQRAYILRLVDRVIDVVATNGFNPVGRGTSAVVLAADWAGATNPHFCRGSYYRKDHIDNNRSSDWELAESCNAASIGSWNPGNLFSTANLDTVSMQSIVHPPVCCKVPITILDKQAPICGRLDSLSSGIPTNLNVAFTQGQCFASTVNIANNCIVGGVRILNMTGTSSQDLGDWEVTLISPRGTRVKLWENVCNSSTAFNLNFGTLDNKGGTFGSINGAACVPNFGNGGFYIPQESFNKFYGEQGQGIWRLEIEDNSCFNSAISNVLTNWRLQVLCKGPSNLRDTTITADFRQCRKKFLWFHPQINDNCQGGTMVMEYVTTCTTARTGVVTTVLGPITKNVTPGACDSLVLPIGTTKITYTLRDLSGNQGMCMFTVNVKDINGPVITAMKDLVIRAEPGECGKFYYFTPNVEDSCGLDTVYSIPPSGTFFPVGKNRVCIYGIDKSGNRDSSCFTLTVEPYVPSSGELACNDLINLSLDASCTAVLNPDMILEGGNHWCYNDYEIIVTDDRGVPHASTFTYNDVGKCFKVTIRDPRTGNSCWGRVCIEDKQKPKLSCPRDTVVSCISTLDPNDLGRAVVTNCEPTAVITYFDEVAELGECAVPYVAVVNRWWFVEDAYGNRDSCAQIISIERMDLTKIRWPRSYDDLDLPHLECSQRINDKDISGHFLAYPDCVDGYLLDSVHWKATGGTIAGGDLSGERLPKALGWNDITSGKFAGHPNPYPVYYQPHPNWNTNQNFCWGPDEVVRWIGTGVPTIDDIDLYKRGRCALSIRYDDEVYDICENSYEILRYWKVRNMCLPVIAGVNPIEYIQVIQVLDKKGPEIAYPDTISLSTGAFDCKAIWDVASPWLKDDCSDSINYVIKMKVGNPVQLANGQWIIYNLPEGLHAAELIASDNCGNKTIKKMMVNVFDGTPPVPVCRTKTVVSITGNQSPGQNIATVYAESFDEGSFDNCKDHIYYKVIQMAELLGTNNGSNANNTVACNGLNGDDNSSLTGNQVYFDDATSFCCTNTAQSVMVVLRVFDVDPGAGPVAPNRMNNRTSPLYGRFNDCMVEVEVQSKNPPTVVAPPNIVVSCWFWFDINKITDPNDPTFGRVVSDLSDRKKVVTQDLVCAKFCERNDITGYPGYVATNTVPKPAPNQACEYYYKYFDTAHWDRKYELQWGFDGYVLSNCGANYTITVNDLRECGQGVIQRIISAQGPNNLNITAIQTIWVVDCDPFYVDDVTCNDPRYTDLLWPNGICTQTPVTIEGCGADISPDNPQLGRPTVINNANDNCSLISIEHFDEIFTIEPDACFKVLRKWVVIDWCQYDPFIDPTKGRWERTQIIKVRDQDKPVVTCNVGPCEPAVVNAKLGVCVGHISLTSSATDKCTPEDWLFYEYKIDAYNDKVGVHGGWDFRVGSLTKKQYAQGDTVEFSHNPFADDPKNPFDASGTYPIGIHRISWFVEDGCGNVGVCETLFEVKDCKAPTPYCHTGIITVPMPSSGCVDIWAKDLDLGSYDNCTSKDKLKFYFDGDPTKASVTVCCDDFVNAKANDELKLEVEMWVEDEEGNKDYCKTTVIVQDNQNICPDNFNNKARISGDLKTEKGDLVVPVNVSLFKGTNLLIQRLGNPYLFGDLEMGVNYTVDPDRNDDHKNGVSTQDVVLIQKHILGQAALNSPYKMIAADVNNSGSITAADLAEIRKLILGINSEFAKVRSWTFIPSEYVFADPMNPYGAPRKSTVYLDSNRIVDFIGVKMGDVNGNAQANNLQVINNRTNGDLSLEIDQEDLIPGELVKVHFRSSDFNQITGYQFTLKFDEKSLAFEGIENGAVGVTEANFGTMALSSGYLTTSWNSSKGETIAPDQILYTLTFRALGSGKLVQKLGITSDITRAEAYNAQGQELNIKLGTRTAKGFEETGVFELYQNEPNPFSKQTLVNYRLPKAGAVKMTIYDLSGKVLRVYELKGQKGLNSIQLKREDLNADGILYYQLDADDHTATKRMILTR
ncbi:MAG: HYR domain-containing protein [Saprospiraceae bacterium]|nr:HYR domain-containing protein [Candidatus Vicinibacter proximus]MCC6844670.1 HYR domain-containing protein [Saprospiraceae bacterium]